MRNTKENQMFYIETLINPKILKSIENNRTI